MCILTLVQIIGNVYSSYKYIMLNSPENLKYFKEPIFIWTQLPDAEATVIITYVSAAILPIVALLMTSMITNYLSDQSEETNALVDVSEKEQENTHIEHKDEQYEEDGPPKGEGLNDKQVIDNLNATLDNRDEEINNLKKELENLRNNKTQFKSSERIVFEIEDELSGIGHYEAKINDQWVLLHYDYKTKTLYHDLNDGVAIKGNNNLILEIKDKMGNSTIFEYSFTLL